MKPDIEQMLDEALRTAPSFKLKEDFQDRVIQRIRKKEKVSQQRLYIWVALGVMAIMGLGYGVIYFFVPVIIQSISNFSGKGMDQIIFLAVIVGMLIILIQYLDQKLIKDRMLGI